jgi:hypothetical protein
VIPAYTVTEAMLVATNVPENDHPVWSAGINYSAGNRVIMTAGVHQIFEAIAPSIGVNPSTDTTGKWVKVSATNRWKAFDEYQETLTSNATMIEYEVTVPTALDAIAFMALDAETVEIRITNTASVVTYNQSFAVVGTTNVASFSYSFNHGGLISELVVSDLPIGSENTVRVRVLANPTARVGLIVFGREVILGEIMDEPAFSIEDYSRKDRDDFGRVDIVKRSFSARGSYAFAIPANDTRRVMRQLVNLRAKPAIWHCANGADRLGTTIYGYPADWSVPVRTAGYSIASLEIEGLV